MGRQPRGVSESGFYHVVVRGAGRQLLFEGVSDRFAFLRFMRDHCRAWKVGVIAWCLMDNHVHLLLEDTAFVLSRVMHRVLVCYAQRFNRRSGHVGPVFQERFRSFPIEGEAYLLEVVRYIHNNPEQAGMGSAETYPWSSYQEYCGGRMPEFTDTSPVLEMLGGVTGFTSFMARESDCPYSPGINRATSEGELVREAGRLIGTVKLAEIRSLPKKRRDRMVRCLKDHGMSIRQIERLTGIGRGIIARA